MNKLCIVGGGTAGLITALILKSRFSSLKIDIVKSDKIGIIGVGEGTTEHWSDFMLNVGITEEELIRETGATMKGGIMFKDCFFCICLCNILTNRVSSLSFH